MTVSINECMSFIEVSHDLNIKFITGGPRLDKPLEEFQLKQQQDMFGALAQQQAAAADAAVFASATPQERTVAAQMAAIAQIAAQQQQQHQQQQHQHQMQQQFTQQQVWRYFIRGPTLHCSSVPFKIQHFMGPPPSTGMHQTPMPPRPRPEGGLEGEHQVCIESKFSAHCSGYSASCKQNALNQDCQILGHSIWTQL